MTMLANLARASFGGIEFPLERLVVTGGARIVEHVAPHVPGSKLEKLGRMPYVIRASAMFVTTAKLYPRLWPERLSQLRTSFEIQTTAELVTPTMGTVLAVARGWVTTATAQLQNGERAELEFVEDIDDVLLAAVLPASTADLDDAVNNYKSEIDRWRREADRSASTDLFTGLDNAINSVLAIQDSIDLYSSVYTQKLEHLGIKSRQLVETMTALQNVDAWRVATSIRDIGFSALRLVQDARERGDRVRSYIVPRIMTIAEVSTAIYGSAAKAGDLLALNYFEDPLSIRVGTNVRYYKDA